MSYDRLVAAQFIAPIGFIEPSPMFPEELTAQVNTRIETAIQEGYAKASGLGDDQINIAVTAWVYHRLFFSVWVSLSGTPSSAAMADQGSILYTSAQIANFKLMSDSYLAEFNAAITTGVQTVPERLVSTSVRHKVRP